MPAYNFQARFAADVESGKKKQTIRACRRDGYRPKVGRLFVGYTGMRTTACRKLVVSEISKVHDISIDGSGVHVDGRLLQVAECEALAIADGFSCASEMIGWFRDTHGHLFDGHIIHWR